MIRTNIRIYLYKKSIRTNIRIYSYQKNDTNMIRTNIRIGKYSNISEYSSHYELEQVEPGGMVLGIDESGVCWEEFGENMISSANTSDGDKFST